MTSDSRSLTGGQDRSQLDDLVRVRPDAVNIAKADFDSLLGRDIDAGVRATGVSEALSH
jgi:hypothetical protein